jgi:hypothetical protein
MMYLIILFGTATIVAGLLIVIKPETVFGLIRRNFESLSIHVLAVAIRIIIGVALIMVAASSNYPTTILVIGWISIIAASILGIIGRTNFKRLMSWALNIAPSFGRIGGIIAILFGAFLIHAVV